jgi:hypothetical protein
MIAPQRQTGTWQFSVTTAIGETFPRLRGEYGPLSPGGPQGVPPHPAAATLRGTVSAATPSNRAGRAP